MIDQSIDPLEMISMWFAAVVADAAMQTVYVMAH
jgi:hypothetical protein